MTSQEAPAGVAVIIVTYNSGQYVKDCLESLGRQTVKPRAVVVVDNASSDDTVDAARAFGADVIVNAGNAGFAAGNNIGARHAVGKYGPEYVLLLNPDTVAHERMIEELQTTLDADPRAGIAQGKIFLLREKGLLNTDGICHHYLYFGYCGGYGLPDRDEGDREIAVASGACLMIRRDVLERLGYLFLDEFFMYHEDTDLCIRARMLGYKCVVSGRAVVWHDYRFSSGKKKFFHMEKNRLFLVFQNYRALTLLLLLPAILFTELQVMLFAVLSGWAGWKFRSYLWLLRNAGLVSDKRHAVQASRNVGDLELLGLFVTDISFEAVDNAGLRYVTNPALKYYYRFVTGCLRLAGGR